MVKRIKSLKGCKERFPTTEPQYESSPGWMWLALVDGAGGKHAGEVWGDGYRIVRYGEYCGDDSLEDWQLLCVHCCKTHGLIW